jgi:transposase-like protein
MTQELIEFNEDGLTAKQEELAILEAYGGMTRVDIAKQLGINRQTLYNWLKKPEIVATIDKHRQEKKNLARSIFLMHLEEAVAVQAKLMKSSDESIRLKASDRIIQYNIGKPTAQLTVNTNSNDGNGGNVPKDILEMEDAEFEQRMLGGHDEEDEREDDE